MPINGSKRISIFTGHYGSGKTEIALNYALHVNTPAMQTVLVDLDFINPYFRSREVREFLKLNRITVIASAEDYFDTDVPALSPQIGGVLQNGAARVIVDLGGDEAGARAVGRFRHHIAEEKYELLFVVNPYRPFTANTEDINVVLAKIEGASRLKVTAFVSNPNLHSETTLEDILSGHRIVLGTSSSLGLPVRFIAVESGLARSPQICDLGLPVLEIKRQMKAPWE